MDPRVIEFLNSVEKRLGGHREIAIVSAYRSAAYNDLLVRQGRGASRHSLHLRGQALDISVAGTATSVVRDTALALSAGGVGYYPKSGFVHLDSGPVRRW
jgi:uncharacterized protein YcbK (DUF882 family)